MLFAVLLAACGSPTPDPDLTCGAGELADGEACVPEACGVGPWGDLPVDDAVHVDAAGTGAGDGSEGAPFVSIQAGLDLAGERGGGLVVVAAGAYMEAIAMADEHQDVALAGRCRELVTIDGSEGGDVPTIGVTGNQASPAVTISGVTLTGGVHGGLRTDHAVVSMSASDVRDNRHAGIVANGGALELSAVGVYDTQADDDGQFGGGVGAQSGADLRVVDSTIRGNLYGGVMAFDGGTAVELVDTEVLDTSAGPDGTFGRGVDVEGGATLTANRCTMQGNTQQGVFAMGAGTLVDLVETLVVDSLPLPDGTGGFGVDVRDGAGLVCTACTVRGNTGTGLFASGAGTTVELVDTSVADTLPTPDGTYGRGVNIEDGVVFSASGCTISGNACDGLYASGAGTTVDLVDTQILATAPNADGTGGRGIEADAGARVTATSCTLQGNSDVGVLALAAGTVVELVETSILDTAASPMASGGRGIGVQDGAVISATDCTIQRSAESGLHAAGAGTSVTLVGTQILDSNGDRGVNVADAAVLTATACLVQRSAQIGLLASGVGTRVELVDTEVSDTSAGPDAANARGVSVELGALLSATRCVFQRNMERGVAVMDAGTIVDLVDTQVLDTTVGANGIGPGVDVESGSALSAIGCTLQGNTGAGVLAWHAGTVVDLANTVIVDTAPKTDGAWGHGIGVLDGAEVTATGCTIDGSTEVGVSASGDGAVLDLVETAILGTRRGRVTAFAIGAGAEGNAVLRLSDSEISGTDGPGIYAVSGAQVELDRAQLTRNGFAGVLVVGGSVTASATTISDTLADAEWGGGFGVYAHPLSGSPTLTLTGSTVGPHPYAAIWLDGPGSYQLDGNAISGGAGVTSGSFALHGNAVFAENGVTAWDGTTGLLLTGNAFSGASQIGVLLDGSSAAMEGNSWSDNASDLRQQNCDGPDGLFGPDEVGFVDDTTPLIDEDVFGIPSALVCPSGNVLTAYDLVFNTLYLPTTEPAQ